MWASERERAARSCDLHRSTANPVLPWDIVGLYSPSSAVGDRRVIELRGFADAMDSLAFPSVSVNMAADRRS